MSRQHYLNIAEKSNDLLFFDIESTGFKADYGSTLVISCKPFGMKATSFPVIQVGNDKKIIREAKEMMENYGCWVSFYGKGFDIPFLNTRLLKWGIKPIEKRLHLDLFFTLKHNTSCPLIPKILRIAKGFSET